MEYAIYEANLERLERKLTFISNKARKYGLNFKFDIVGEEFRNVSVEVDYLQYVNVVRRFVIVNVEGDVVKHNDWVCVATVERPANVEANIIRQFNTEYEIPTMYWDAPMHCDHCGTTRNRSKMYLVYNTVSNEWKMVGSDCLKEFTDGLDPVAVTAYFSYFDEVIKGGNVGSGRGENYYSVGATLLYASEAVRMYGYRSSQEYRERTTKEMTVEHSAYAEDMWGGKCRLSDKTIETVREEIDKGFDPYREDNVAFVKDAIEWITNYDVTDESLYMHNLKTIVVKKYAKYSELGILVSLIPTYKRAMARKAKEEVKNAEIARKADVSNYVGNVGDKVDFEVKGIALITSFDNDFGTTYLYEMEDVKGNVYKWFASRCYDIDAVKFVRGTVKKHDDYRGIKSTVLTRCKLA